MSKIIILCPDHMFGGVYTASSSLAQAFRESGMECDLVFIQKAQGNRIKQWFQAVYSIARAEDASVNIICMHFYGMLFGLFLGFLGFKNRINVFHTDIVDYYSRVGVIKKVLFRFFVFVFKNKPVVFVSKESKIKAELFFNFRNSFVIYNLFNPCSISTVASLENKATFGVVSRLDSMKNIDIAIFLIHLLRRHGYDVDLSVYGAGDQESELKSYAHKLKVSDFVYFKGYCNEKDKIFNSFKYLLSFSSLEGFGIVILEAISHSVPVFHSDCSSGPRELMAPHTNPLFKTSRYESTAVGFLVKQPMNEHSYKISADGELNLYYEAAVDFLSRARMNEFSMRFDWDRFSSKTILENWVRVFEVAFSK